MLKIYPVPRCSWLVLCDISALLWELLIGVSSICKVVARQGNGCGQGTAYRSADRVKIKAPPPYFAVAASTSNFILTMLWMCPVQEEWNSFSRVDYFLYMGEDGALKPFGHKEKTVALLFFNTAS